MIAGLWRDGHWVEVSYHSQESVPISKELYEQRGYWPPYDVLPTRDEYEASHPR